MGLKEQIVFPEIDFDQIDDVLGMDIIICTNAKTDAEAKALLKQGVDPMAEKRAGLQMAPGLIEHFERRGHQARLDQAGMADADPQRQQRRPRRDKNERAAGETYDACGHRIDLAPARPGGGKGVVDVFEQGHSDLLL